MRKHLQLSSISGVKSAFYNCSKIKEKTAITLPSAFKIKKLGEELNVRRKPLIKDTVISLAYVLQNCCVSLNHSTSDEHAASGDTGQGCFLFPFFPEGIVLIPSLPGSLG